MVATTIIIVLASAAGFSGALYINWRHRHVLAKLYFAVELTGVVEQLALSVSSTLFVGPAGESARPGLNHVCLRFARLAQSAWAGLE